jgi:arylformamidase
VKEFFDLSHEFDENTYHPFGFPRFQNIQMYPSHGCRHALVTMSLHFATHMDAPWHMVEAGKRLDEISIAELIGDALIVDVSDTHAPDRGDSGEISLADIQRSLSAHRNDLRKGDALLIHTGWSALYKSDPSRYYAGYPTLSPAACEWAVKTGVRLFGIDAPDVDPPESYLEKPFHPTNHRLLLGNDVYVIENIGGEIDALLHQRVLLIPAPMKLGGEYASGAPVRLLATRRVV